MIQNHDKESIPRYRSLDILKGIGIVYLIILHQIIWVFTQSDGMGLRFEQATSFVSWIFYQSGMHVFGSGIPVIAGASFVLFIKHKNPSISVILRRGLYLIFVGFVMNALAWGPYNILDWDVLGFIGLSTIFSYLLLRLLPEVYAYFVFFFLIVLSLFLSNQFPFLSISENYLYKIIFGDIHGLNYWPFFPWYALFASGMFIGLNFFYQKKKWINIQIIVGCVLCVISLLSSNYFPPKNLDQIWGVALFKPSPLFILGLIGPILVVSVIFEYLAKKEFFKSKMFSILENFGKSVLWIYFWTIVVGYNLTVRLILTKFTFTYQQTVMMFFLLVFLQFALSYFVSRRVVLYKGRL